MAKKPVRKTPKSTAKPVAKAALRKTEVAAKALLRTPPPTVASPKREQPAAESPAHQAPSPYAEAMAAARTKNDWGATSRTELEKMIASFKGTVTMLVTPTIAAYLLEKNTGNRKLRPTKVAENAELILTGRYQNTGEPIIMSDEAILNNGQHRLSGVVVAGKGVEMDIRFGIPRKAFQVTDTHSKRLAGDVLADRGDVSVFAVAAAAKLLLAYEQGLPGSYWQKTQNDQIATAVDRWPDLHDAVHLTQRSLKSRKGFFNASSNAFTFLAMRQAGEEAVEEFLKIVESGATPNITNPARLLRERLLTDDTLRRAVREVVIERFALFIKAWNMWRAGSRPSKLSWRGFGEKSNEEFPIIEGVNLKAKPPRH